MNKITFINEIEQKYPVNEIMYKNIHIWSVLRIYLYDKKITNKKIHLNIKIIVQLIRSVLSYNFFNLFKKYKFWIFSSESDRIVLDNLSTNKISGLIPDIEKRTLLFESPHVKSKWITNRKRKEENIVSETILYFLTLLFICIEKLTITKIEKKEILINICKELNIDIKFSEAIVHRFIAQYKALKLLLLFVHKPKVVFINCPYTKMGYICALREKQIKVIELQHGVINENHYAYNSTIKNTQLIPEFILVYGQYEKDLFSKVITNYTDKNKTISIGSYILNYYKNKKVNDIFIDFKNKYQIIVLVSGQDDIEHDIINFLNAAAKLDDTIYYAYVPRYNNKKPFIETNVGYFNSINIYEAILCCDIHSTVYSTTCKEANYLGILNVFINISNFSKLYYGNILTQDNGAYYSDNPEGYLEIIREKASINRIKFDSTYFYNNDYRSDITNFTRTL